MENNSELIDSLTLRIRSLSKHHKKLFAQFLVSNGYMKMSVISRGMMKIVSKIRGLSDDEMLSIAFFDDRYGDKITNPIISQTIEWMKNGKDGYGLAAKGGFCKLELREIDIQVAKYEYSNQMLSIED